MDHIPGSSKQYSEENDDVSEINLTGTKDNNQEKTCLRSKDSDNTKIACTNISSIREIMKEVSQQISQFASLSNLGDEKEQFISRFMTVFTEAIQENITVNDLPCIIDKSILTSEQKQNQAEMINNALSAKLADTVATVAKKRKYCPQDYCRILEMKLKKDRVNLKKLKVQHSSSALPSSAFEMDPISTDKLRGFVEPFAVFKEKIQQNVDEIKRIKNNIAFATEIANRNESLSENISFCESKDI